MLEGGCTCVCLPCPVDHVVKPEQKALQNTSPHLLPTVALMSNSLPPRTCVYVWRVGFFLLVPIPEPGKRLCDLLVPNPAMPYTNSVNRGEGQLTINRSFQPLPESTRPPPPSQ